MDELGIHDDIIDFTTFSQILEMDEPGDREFSMSIVYSFFDQAEDTFTNMETALEDKDAAQLSALGHFLRGSAGTLGLFAVREHSETIERLGKLQDVEGEDIDVDDALDQIKATLSALRDSYAEAREVLVKYYDSEEDN